MRENKIKHSLKGYQPTNKMLAGTLRLPALQLRKYGGSIVYGNKNNMYGGGIWGAALGNNNSLNNATCEAMGFYNTCSGGTENFMIGYHNICSATHGSIIIGNSLTNTIDGSIIMGNYSLSGGIPTISIIPDASHATFGFVGIGTTGTPDATFSIMNNSSKTNQFSINNSGDVFTIDNNGNTYAAGNMGIGTTTPIAQFQINSIGNGNPSNVSMGGMQSWGPYYATSYLGFNAARGTNGEWTIGSDGSNSNGGVVLSSGVYGDLHFVNLKSTNGSPYTLNNDGDLLNNISMTLTNTGRLGIGTTTPSYPLDVDGVVRANEFKVCNFGTCDFVFDKAYKLMSLEELENYLNLNHHLPGIPSSAEMEGGNGVELGKMNAQLLQKVEEQTLYIIELNKRLEKVEAELAKMKENK